MQNLVGLLTPAKEKNKYLCPCCNGHNLSVNLGNGAYQCFNGCNTKEIFKVLVEQYQGGITKPAKVYTEPVERKWVHLDYTGNPIMRYVRKDYPDPDKKPLKISQYLVKGKWVNSGEGVDKSKIALYRFEEVKKAIANDETIFIAEGQKCCDALWELGLAATTNHGGAGSWQKRFSNDLKDAKNIVLCPDRDVVGVNHALSIFQDFPHAKWLYSESKIQNVGLLNPQTAAEELMFTILFSN